MGANSLKNIAKRIVNLLQPKNVVNTTIAQLDVNSLLKERVALITGGTSGIGMAIAEAFLKSGAKVVITGRSENKIKKSLDELSRHGCCAGIVMDITKVDSLQAKLKEAVSIYGKIDILVNNAGVSGALVANATEGEYDAVMDTNLKGVFFLSQAVGKYMVGENIAGNILNISSASSIRPAACAYTLSKWGIRGFTMGLARTLLPYNIVVNALAPGPTATPLLKKGERDDDISLPRTPSGRYAMPCEIANMAVILVSPLARLIVGDTIFMTGGAGNVNNGDIDYPF